MKNSRKKAQNKYLPLTIYIIVFIILVDVLALVLFSTSLDNTKKTDDDTSYYPGKTDPVKVEDMPIDTEIKVDKTKGCTKEVINELKKEAEKIKFSYEPYERREGYTEGEDEGQIEVVYNSLKIIVENVTPNIALTIKDNLNPSNTYKFDYSDVVDGKVSFEPKTMSKVVTYYVTISSNTTECGIQPIKKVSAEVPKVNQMITYDICEDVDDIKECAYFTWDDYSLKDVKEALSKKTTTTSQTGSSNSTTTTTKKTTTAVNKKTTTTKKVETKDEDKKDNIKNIVTIIIIILVGVLAIIIVIAGACVISKKRG